MFVRVAIPIPSAKTFTYAVPEMLQTAAAVGKRVVVPVGSKRMTGWMVEILTDAACTQAVRDIIDLPDPEPLFDSDDLALYEWISRYYLHPLGRVLAEILPGEIRVRPRLEKSIGVNAEIPAGIRLTPKQSALVALIREKGELPLSGLEDRFRETAFLRTLEGKGIIHVRENEPLPRIGQTQERGKNGHNVILNEPQADALEEIRARITSECFSPILLHGVTGSGKTEIYLRAADDVLRRGGSVIYLVPEIALTAQLLSNVLNRFPGREIAVIHSDVTRSSRYDQWKRIRSGDIRLVVGARSAIFAPVRDLRLIVVDEEHDPSYKQDDRLRYNARDLALVRGKSAGAVVILGSATPGIQTFFQTKGGAYGHLNLPFRVDGRPLPAVEVVDMKTERDEKGRTPLISRALITAIGETLADSKQTLLFLNRRGFHTFLFCPDCGHVLACPSCDLSLTHHASMNVLKCHHCDFRTKPPTACPACHGNHIRSQGAGTERVEDEVRKLFPEARIARMDSDTTSRKGEMDKILQSLRRREIDILVGTQMITKGHDFPGITLVGVIAADASMNIPDFRAAERTFQLLTQVSGRGGRGDQPGRVVVQTFNPGHYAIRRAQEHDYDGFYEDELPLRRELRYPPFSRLIGLHFSSLKKEEGKRAVAEIGKKARAMAADGTGGKADVIGPAESPLARIRGRYRWQMLLRGQESGPLHRLAERLVEGSERSGLEIRVDVDPVHFM